MYPTPELVKAGISVWAVGFIDAGLTPRQIDYGIHAANIRKGFCPDLPEFIAMCTPTATDLGLPSLRDAYHEAAMNAHPSSRKPWSHDAVRYAASLVGSYDMANESEEITRPRFEHAYKRACDMALSGEPFPGAAPMPAWLEDNSGKLVTPEEKAADKERGRSMLRGLIEDFSGVDASRPAITRNEQIRRMELEEQIEFMMRKEARA
jgi:hypothetical protein